MAVIKARLGSRLRGTTCSLLIHSWGVARINPFDRLTELQRRRAVPAATPATWTP
jgi:hypothetical protein